jgi:GNAT superfamily N-acetyltransferase
VSAVGEYQIVDVTDDHGKVIAPDWLARAEPVHRQLRERLPVDYAGRLGEIFRSGARMTIVGADGTALGVALWRVIENTYEGRRFYVDDLVTDSAHRSSGVGKFLLGHLEARARQLGCNVLTLDSGTQRTAAHKFYFREGMIIPGFAFRKELA